MSNYIFPQKCCVCMGPAETQQKVSKNESFGSVNASATVNVPICLNCKKEKFDSPIRTCVITSIVIGCILGLVIFPTDKDLGPIAGLIMGGFLGGIASIFFLQKVKDKLPVRILISNTDFKANIFFENEEYRKLFLKVNYNI